MSSPAVAASSCRASKYPGLSWGRESWETARDFVYPNAFNCDPCTDPLPAETRVGHGHMNANGGHTNVLGGAK